MAELVIPSEFLDKVHAICGEKGYTLETIIEVLGEAMTSADVFSKNGDVIPDQKTRVAAAKTLLQLLQVPLATKITTLRRGHLTGNEENTLEQIIRSRQAKVIEVQKQQEGTA